MPDSIPTFSVGLGRFNRWSWLACIMLASFSLLTRIGYRIRDVFLLKSNQGILWGGDWPVLDFCNQHHQTLRVVSVLFLGLIALISFGVAWRVKTRRQRIGPALCAISSLLQMLIQLSWIRGSAAGIAGLGLSLGLWSLLEVWEEHGSGLDEVRVLPPYHWAPGILLATCSLAILEVLVVSQIVTSRFPQRDVVTAALTSSGVSGIFGAFLGVLVFGSLIAALPFWNRTKSVWGTGLFGLAVSGLWTMVLFGPAYPAFRPTLSSFGILRETHELVFWFACCVASLSIWGHLAALDAGSVAIIDGTWRILGIALSPLRGLIKLFTGRAMFSSRGPLFIIPMAVLSCLFVLAFYLTYWEFMDYSRALHKSTVALMLMCWVGMFLVLAELLVRWLRPGFRCGPKAAIVVLVVLVGLFTIPLTRASRWLSGNVEFLIVDKTEINRIMVWWLRNRWDPDRDGYSNWLGGDDPTKFVTGKTVELAANSQGNAQANPPVAVPSKRKPFVLITTVETFRSDCTGVYPPGTLRAVTPRIDEFARENVTFANSYSTSNSTLPSQAALLTGSYPSRFLKKKRQLVLLETLAAAGYQTLLTEQVYQGVFTTNLNGDPKMFQEYKVLDGWYANETLPNLIADLDQRGSAEGVCAVFHLNGAHFPYKPSKGFPETDDKERYLQCLAEVDAAWGQFIQDLKSRGWYDNTLIVLTGDHGEEFWEHGHKYHGMYIYQESVRTPIIIHSPGAVAGIYQGGSATIDILPTVAELLGVTPIAKVDGSSRAFALRGDVDPMRERNVYLIGAHSDTYGVISEGRWKLTFNRGLSYFELYDLHSDPQEVHNLIDEEPLIFQKLRGMVADFIEAGKGLYTDPDPFQEGK